MTPRHLAIFTARFLALLVAFVPLWAVLAPFYAGLLAGLGNSALALLGLPPLLSLKDRDILLTVTALHIQIMTVTASFYGVPVLVALVWAVPALSRRMRLSLLSLGAMALFHWLNLLGQVGMLLSNQLAWQALLRAALSHKRLGRYAPAGALLYESSSTHRKGIWGGSTMRYFWGLFFAKVLIFVLVFALASPVILSFYSGLQIGLVRPFVRADFTLRLQPDGSIYVSYQNYSQPVVEREVTSFSGLGLLIALFLATPIPWRWRLARLGLGTLLLLSFHLLALWGLIAIWDAMFRSGGISFGMRWAYTLMASGDWLAPLASWGLLGYVKIAAQRIRLEKGGGAHASV